MTAREKSDRNATFEFARLLRKPDFRAFMLRNKYVPSTTVVVVHDDERVKDVFSRILTETEPPVVLALHRPAASPWGFCFLTIGQPEQNLASDAGPARDDDSRIGLEATIGMLYDTMAAQSHRLTNLEVPNEWNTSRFRVGLASC